MKHVPITFDYNEKRYSGNLNRVHGAGEEVWQLLLDNYFFGTLPVNKLLDI